MKTKEKIQEIYRRWRVLAQILMCVTVVITVNALIIPARTTTGDENALCGLADHRHTEDCYDEQGKLICGLPEHEHDMGCFAKVQQTLPEYLCGLSYEHTHTEDCYGEDGSLICSLTEHQHDASCYPEEAEGDRTSENEGESNGTAESGKTDDGTDGDESGDSEAADNDKDAAGGTDSSVSGDIEDETATADGEEQAADEGASAEQETPEETELEESEYAAQAVSNVSYIKDKPVHHIDRRSMKYILTKAFPDRIGLSGDRIALADNLQVVYYSMNLSKGDIIVHKRLYNMATINGITYDMELTMTSLVNATLAPGVSYGVADDIAYFRFLQWGFDYAVPTINVSIKFLQSGTNNYMKVPSLAYGISCWDKGELFKLQDFGYDLYTPNDGYTYDSTKDAWTRTSNATTGFGDWDTLWSYTQGTDEINFSMYDSGMEVTLGYYDTSVTASAANASIQYAGNSTLELSETTSLQIQQSDASGNVTSGQPYTLSNTTASATVPIGSTESVSASGGSFGQASYVLAGTYYNLITQNVSSPKSYIQYDTSKWLQRVVVSQNISTLALSATVQYKKIGTSTWQDSPPTFVNTYVGNSLTVTKHVVGASTDEKFSFTVYYEVNGNTWTPKGNQIPNDATVNGNKISFSLGNGESVILPEIPGNSSTTQVYLAEQTKDSYTTYIQENGTTVSASGTYNAIMDNKDHTWEVYNTTGATLPSTGGRGAEVIQLLGIALMCSAVAGVVVLVRYQRKKKQK